MPGATRGPLGPRLERGASAAEYALLITLIAVAIVLAVIAFGLAVSDLFGDASSLL